MKNLILLFIIPFIASCVKTVTITTSPDNVIPEPKAVAMNDGVFTINANTSIYVNDRMLNNEAAFLSSVFDSIFGTKPDVSLATGGEGILLQIDNTLLSETGDEGYILTVTDDGIRIEAGKPAGIFYGIQTLRRFFPPELEFNADPHRALEIPACRIYDKPRFSWRAFMLDEARYFKGKKVVKKLLNEMALMKMNVFHWHLVDDQGWRIEIKKYPKLTEVGSKRKNSMIGGWKSDKFSGKPHEGFYTQDDIREIIDYAAKRHITIVPEIEMPGHSASAIAAYPWLGAVGDSIDVPVTFGYKYDIYDVTKPEVVKFLKDVLVEVMELFPSRVIHIGGDEVDYSKWKQSKSIMAYMKKHGIKSPAELQIRFTNDISAFIEYNGRRMMGWNEILGGVSLHKFQNAEDVKTTQTLAKNSIIHFWKGDLSLAEKAVKEGYDIVNSLHSKTYLDYDYKMISLKKAYMFDPVPAGLDSVYFDKVLGLGCQMWGEWIPTVQDMEFMTYPRIAAYAEDGWSGNADKNFPDFNKRVDILKKRWDLLGINYGRNNEEKK